MAPGRLLATDEHGVWARPTRPGPWRFELLVDDVAGGRWMYRRNPAVRLPLAQLGRATPTGLPYLRPEVVLLDKAKQPRAADERDAAAAIPLLSRQEHTWLAEAIARDTPTHPWLSRLRCPDRR